MTKEELKKEAQEQVNRCTPLYPECFIQGYIASAEPREKRIEELEQELTVEKDLHQEEINLHLHAEDYIKSLEQQIKKMKRHCNCKHRDSEGYCEVKRTYLMDLSYDGCDKWELEEIKEIEK